MNIHAILNRLQAHAAGRSLAESAVSVTRELLHHNQTRILVSIGQAPGDWCEVLVTMTGARLNGRQTGKRYSICIS